MATRFSKPSQRFNKFADFDPVTFSELNGIRYLHFGSPNVQGAMRVLKPDHLELAYTQLMMAWALFPRPEPETIVQFGLGAGSLTKFCHRHCPTAVITVVERNPDVLAAARSMFRLPPNDERLQVLILDAMTWAMDARNHLSADILQVDVYDAAAQGPVLDTPAFYRACAQVLRPDGVMAVNLFGNPEKLEKSVSAMQQGFNNGPLYVSAPLPEGNVIAFATHRLLWPSAQDALARAEMIEATWGLPARRWLGGTHREFA